MSDALSMKDVLKPENVRVLEGGCDWKTAIDVAVRPLVSGGYAEERYIDGIVENTEELGPYYIICPNLALLHARPEQGALKTQVSVTVMRKGIEFGADKDPVQLLVSLVATDSDSHIEVMRTLATLFCEPGSVDRLVAKNDSEAIYRTFVDASDAS